MTDNSGPGIKALFMTLVALLILTGITIGVSRVDLGPLNIATALLVASIKVTLVLFFFMELKQAGKLVVISFVGTVIALALLIGFLFFDVAYR